MTRLYHGCVQQAYYDAIGNKKGRKDLLKSHTCTDNGENVANCSCDEINAIESDLRMRTSSDTEASPFLKAIKEKMLEKNMENCHQDTGNENIPCGEAGATNCCNVTTFLDGE